MIKKSNTSNKSSRSNIKRIKTCITFGFTMIELLVVISIIAVLATLVMVSFTSSQKQAKDTQRKSDIRQYQTALEGYTNKSGGLYPSRTVKVDPSSLCSTLGISGTCPTDPKPPAVYSYISSGSGNPNSDATDYVLWATLENQTGNYYIVCSIGKIGVLTSAPTSSTCPL